MNERDAPETRSDDRDEPRSAFEEPAGGPPRLEPRPLDRPDVDAGAAAVFGRPLGVEGGFAGSRGLPDRSRLAAPPSAALASAFGRPAPDAPSLQRPSVNGKGSQGTGEADPFWTEGAARDPWRNPDSDVALGPPAAAEPPDDSGPRREGARLSLREVLFGRRVEPRALAGLALVAVLVGAAGGLVGRFTADSANSLTNPNPTITQTVDSVARPPGSVADIAQRTVPAVVSIEIRVGEEGGTGSGVVIDPAGYVLTNNHVIAPAATATGGQIEVIFHDGTRAAAQVVGRDPKTDLAVIHVGVANPVVATFGSSANLVVGDGVIAIGSPLGLAGTVTDGIVSALNRPVRLDGSGTDTNAVIDAIQTDAAINPGNSGGALVDATGAVVGINTAIRSVGGGEGGSIGLGFAIPIDDARGIAEELIRGGAVRHAEIGINARSVSDGTTDGAQVQNVQQGGAAAAAGIIDGDVIVKVGDRPIAGADELVVAVRERNPGDTVAVELIRDGRPLTVSVVLTSD